MTNHVIITPDHSSGGTLRQFMRNQGQTDPVLFSCFDDFTFGPLFATADPEKFFGMRHKYWRRNLSTDWVGSPGNQPPMRQLLRCVDELEIWLAASGREQLFLLGLVNYLGALTREACQITIVQYPSDSEWESLGTKAVDALAERPAPIALSECLANRLRRVWAGIVEPTPHDLFEMAATWTDIPELPWLKRAITDLTTSYPDKDSGLSLADERRIADLSP